MRQLILIVLIVISISQVTLAQDFSPVEQFVAQAVTDRQIAGGCILVLKDGEVIFEHAFGYADIESQIPYEMDMPAVIASISKPLLGTVAFRLAEAGKLDLARPISEYLPEFEDSRLESGEPLERAPTTFELFTHTSGMRPDKAEGGRPWFAKWARGKSLEEVVRQFATEFHFKTRPGSRYAYSGIGTDIAARVLEVVGRESRNELLQSELTVPLGMTGTFYRDQGSLQQVEGRMPTRYYLRESGQLVKRRVYPVPPGGTYSASGGSVISTAQDLAQWLLMIRNHGSHNGEQYLDETTLAKMLEPYPGSYNVHGGLAVKRRNEARKIVALGHTGSSGTSCWIDFERDVIGIILTQTGGQFKPFRLGLEEQINNCFGE